MGAIDFVVFGGCEENWLLFMKSNKGIFYEWSHLHHFQSLIIFFKKLGVNKDPPLRIEGIPSPDRIMCRCRESYLVGSTGGREEAISQSHG